MTLVPVATTRTVMTQIVLPTHTNNHGTAFGGQIAAWVDICAAVSAQRFCRGAVVTASMDQLHFMRPVRRGMVVELSAQVNCAWGSSMEVGVRVVTEDPHTGARERCCSAYLTFVALDESGRKRSIPGLDAGDDAHDRRRVRQAGLRRQARLQMRDLLRNSEA